MVEGRKKGGMAAWYILLKTNIAIYTFRTEYTEYSVYICTRYISANRNGCSDKSAVGCWLDGWWLVRGLVDGGWCVQNVDRYLS